MWWKFIKIGRSRRLRKIDCMCDEKEAKMLYKAITYYISKIEDSRVYGLVEFADEMSVNTIGRMRLYIPATSSNYRLIREKLKQLHEEYQETKSIKEESAE